MGALETIHLAHDAFNAYKKDRPHPGRGSPVASQNAAPDRRRHHLIESQAEKRKCITVVVDSGVLMRMCAL